MSAILSTLKPPWILNRIDNRKGNINPPLSGDYNTDSFQAKT